MNDARVARMKFALQVIATYEANDPYTVAKMALEEGPHEKMNIEEKITELEKEIHEKLEELRNMCRQETQFVRTGVDDTEYAKKNEESDKRSS